MGSYKIFCEARAYESKFYDDTYLIEDATIIEINSLNQTFEQFDFILTEQNPSDMGNISGMVYEEGNQVPIELAEVLAVNLHDENIWGASFSMFYVGPSQLTPVGSYFIENLPVGNYIVCAYEFVSGHQKKYYNNVEF